jgi:hypothetical protein
MMTIASMFYLYIKIQNLKQSSNYSLFIDLYQQKKQKKIIH